MNLWYNKEKGGGFIVKKYLAGFIVGIMVTLGITVFADEITNLVAEKATFEVFVAGEKFESDKPVAVINGSTYLPLKDTGEALGVDVQWNAVDRRVEIGDMNKDVKSQTTDDVALSPTPVSPTQIPSATNTPSEKFGSYTSTKQYYFKSNIYETDSKGKHDLISYQNDQYIPMSLFGANIKKEGEDYYIQLPGKDPVLAQSNMGATNISYKYNGRIYVRLSSVELKARIEGDTAYLEWLN